tara:strand:+ start:3685 stop:4353 length:669 start_codon:yes stop_codon:yes gene_type:complete
MNMTRAKIKTDIPDELREPLLNAALAHIPFEGWTDNTLGEAARDLDIPVGIARLAFPGGAADMIDFLADRCDQRLAEQAKLMDLESLKIRERIKTLIHLRLLCEEDHRESTRRGITWLALPQNQALGLKLLYRTVDLIWRLAGDTSADFNYYTKRLTLAGVYSSTVLYWLNDDSEEFAETWAFLDRRIEDVMKIEKTKMRLREICDKLPDVWRLAGKIRYRQ